MTIPSTARKAGPLLGTGAQTAWPFTFKVFAAADVAVTIADSLGVETALVLDTDYSVTLNANQETSPGGTVTYPISGTALAVGSKLSIIGDLDYDQPLDLPSGGNFSPLALENQLDRTIMQVQQLEETASRALLVPVTSSASSTLPNPEPNALIGWDSTGDTLANYTLAELATGIAYGTMRFDTFVGDGTTTQFALTEDPAALANLDVSIAGVTQVPGTDYTLTSATLVFTTAPVNGVAILARYGRALPISGPVDSSAVTHVATGTGAVATTVQTKLRESVSVKDFGAVGDGVADDTVAFTAALAASKLIRVPAGSYIISSTLYFSNHNIIGDGSKYPGGTLITMTGNMPLFQYNGAYEYGTTISGIFIDYGDAIPSSGSTKIGINIPNVAAWPAFYTFQNLRIRGCHVGINDAAASWHGRYTQVWAEKCRLGFYKLAGTDMVYEQCYAHDGYQAYDIENTIGAVFIVCAFDNNTDPDAVPIFRATNVTGLVINGMDQETNVLTANGNSMMKIDYCNGFLISGIGIVNNKISPATGENYWMQISNTSIGEVVGCNTATLTYDKAGGGTTVYIIVVSNTASVAIKGCNLAEIIQTTTPSATRSVGNSGTGKVTLEATRTTDATSNVYLVSSALNGLLTQSAFNTSASQAVALVAGTPVTICSVAGYGTYLVTCYANNGNNTIYQSVSIVVNDGSLATITALKAGANNVLTLSGTNVQATCSGTTTGSYSVIKIV